MSPLVRSSRKGNSPIDKAAEFLIDYIALPEAAPTIISAWVGAAWLCDVWDRFPHLAISSPEKRCGKTTLLNILRVMVPRPMHTSNISPAALYRAIAKNKPTLLFDEAQSLSRVGTESGEVNREILNASIEKDSVVIRCGGRKMEEIHEFPVYSPKVFAMIGDLDGVLADRSLPVPMRRRTSADTVQRYRSRVVEARGKALHDELEAWAEQNTELARQYYDTIEPFGIENDRMAELLLPLQAVLTITGKGIDVLEAYARTLDERDRQQESQSPGVRLLSACREQFDDDTKFISTATLIDALKGRTEEPWHRWNRGEGLNPEGLAKLLRPFNIKSQHDITRTVRGYHKAAFAEAWGRYLTSPVQAVPNPSRSSKGKAQ